MLNKNKFHPSQKSLKMLIQLVKKIKSNKIYALYGIGTMSHVWNYMMFIFLKNNNYYIEVYKDIENKIEKVFKKMISKEEFIKLIKMYAKKWEFDESLTYSNI